MPRTGIGLRDEQDARLTALEGRHGEWRTWLGLLRVAAGARDGGWYAPVTPAPAGAHAASAPLLHGSTLQVDAARVRALLTSLLGCLFDGEGSTRWPAVGECDGVALLEAGLRSDAAAVERLARSLGIGAPALEAVAEFLALPPLDAAARSLASALPDHWTHGYCPLCGGRPSLAELRGLDGARLLRCGRCGSAWSAGWLRCAHCGESDHDRLGQLLPEGSEETRKVETCSSCHGYLKAMTTLQAAPLVELLLRDLETVELDLAALERGYARPSGPGHRLDVRVVAPGTGG